jgi:hypothetical protein
MSKEAIKLSDNIQVLSDFQFSINIEYDLLNDTKIKNYIPTASAIDIIEDVMLSTSAKSTDRARIFVGAYGKGKSHLALMLLALLCRKEKALYSNLLSMICETKPELCKYISDYQESSQKMLPVVIQGSSVGIRQAFLLALRKALQNNGLDDIMPNTYFAAAIKSINVWKVEYPETYSKFKDLINCSTTEFISELGQYNNDYYEQFVTIYPKLTAGSEFNPSNGMNIVDLYNDVNDKIRKHGYTGIYVVFDEFSKFLAGNISKTKADEIEQLQYFAANCNRSGEKQMHIMLISHQSILNYVDKLTKAKVDAWKAVSGRFKSIELNTSSIQMYEITSRVIKKNDEWFAEYSSAPSRKPLFEETYQKWRKKRAFSDLTDDELKRVVWGCYPMHPVTTFLLPKVSEKIAQNERTLFTFLSVEGQKYTLPSFLRTGTSETLPLMLPDAIFDYFEPLFKADGYDRPTHKLWKTATVALNKLQKTQKLEAKIIKTIALIYILDRVDILAPNIETIIAIFGNDATQALTTLTDGGIVRHLENKKYLRIAEHTDVDVDALVNDMVQKKMHHISVRDILSSFVGDRVLYPNSYNDDKEIIRFFRLKFIPASDLLQSINFEYELEQTDGDGIVYAIVTDADNYVSTVEYINSVVETRVMFILSNESNDIVKYAYAYDAIKDIILQSEDEILKEELSYSLLDASDALESYIDAYLRPELGKANYYYQGEQISIRRKSALSKQLSDICIREFALCPTINNEIINKNVITGQATNSRAKVVEGILANEIQPNLGLVGSGQDVSFMRSTLKMTGIYTEDNGVASLQFTSLTDANLEHVLAIIKQFILKSSAEGKKNFSELYTILTHPMHHIGMKKGVIPIYIAVILHFFKKYAVITKNNREIEINARLLESINNNPADYDIYLEQWDNAKEEYITSLETIFSAQIRVVEKEYNNFDYIVRAIQRWYMQLPKYVKEIKNAYAGDGNTEPVNRTAWKFLNSLRAPEINARQFLFDKLLWVFDISEFDIRIVDEISNTKTYVESIKKNLIDHLSNDLKKIFGGKKIAEGATLPSLVADWVDSLDEDVHSHVFSNSEKTLLTVCTNVTPDCEKFIEDLARPATNLRIDDWGEITIDCFVQVISDFVATVTAYNEKTQQSVGSSITGSYKISYVDDAGNESFKTYNQTELSSTANLLYNDIEAMLTEEYGASLSSDEKRQVLIDIIGKLLS